ncbi:putative cell survival pathways protein [Puccinia graminis f. sp. tritici]|uniref:Putative cell survival pathways protein n=1 Tax=Puccinia graminis f. sp. tritici TaxID=56615 RepID=A0A5B0MRT5_PUCGR|nr:putative cell survival pathways protein [Puccinia graminis f. sp. tritici]KAA1082916.1 putative cell survival pathways protein [Puccinia graminis f. sp. tritici]KAA1100850.1 putative cell survival pathways protein [Puccinia graminis f. sp. tritici]KAA1124144.1 putative cell survival pathways protein [Puccinia graminis f. sp. tritici]
MSWFSVEPPQAQSPTQPAVLVHPTSSRYQPGNLLGELKDEDTSWLAQSSGFVTETQTFYITLPGNKLAMCQVIHSAIGLWYPQIQFTFRFVDQGSGAHHWKSTNVTNFKTPPASSGSSSVKYDRRSCKADQFSILLDPAQPDRYTITGKHDDSIHIQFSVTRMADVPGWKLGQDARGGLTYFGRWASKEPSKSGPDYGAGSDGYLVHRFWPRCSVSGRLLIDGKTVELDGSRAIFVHAIQGMRPNLIASRWNFCNFQSVRPLEPLSEGAEDTDPGVSLTLMEFTTVPGSYGPPQTITVGSIVVGDKLVGICCSPNPSEHVDSKTTHQAPLLHDVDTGYQVPSSIKFEWMAPVLANALGSSAPSTDSSPLSATAHLVLDLEAKRISEKESYVTKGLIEKVDVMAQIPYLVKKVISAVAGARPYIYTWLNPVEAHITLPNSALPNGFNVKTEAVEGEASKFTIHGHLFNEATFISDL